MPNATETVSLRRAMTYHRDLPLFKQLGLEPFDHSVNVEQHYVGTVILEEGAYVMIWVDCMPAQFWAFRVRSKEGAETRCETGSGALSDFWPAVMLITAGRFVLKSIENAQPENTN